MTIQTTACITCGLPIFPTGADPDATYCPGRGRHGETSTIAGPRQIVEAGYIGQDGTILRAVS